MTKNLEIKNLVKILIGAAWIDGKIQPEERQYLRQVAQDKGVADDPEIQPLLNEFRTVKPTECYGWIQAYLGDRPSSEDCQHLIEAISGLFYSDGEIATEEAKLLTRLQLLDPASGGAESGSKSVLKAIQNLYHRWISNQN
jgi:uncharacterized tellurite resistance protein B-like protein